MHLSLVGVEPFYNQTCKLFYIIGEIKEHLRPLQGKRNSNTTNFKRFVELKLRDGVYFINGGGLNKEVCCEMTTDGGGRIVIHNVQIQNVLGIN